MKGVVGNMENLPFQNEELDLIWSEGAIYNIGFERGLNKWRKFLSLDHIDQIEPLNIEARYPSYMERLLKSLTERKCQELIDYTKQLQKWIKKKL